MHSENVKVTQRGQFFYTVNNGNEVTVTIFLTGQCVNEETVKIFVGLFNINDLTVKISF